MKRTNPNSTPHAVGSVLRPRLSTSLVSAPSFGSSIPRLDSQAGPFAARIFTAGPTSPELSLAPSHFRVLLLRRLLYGSLCCSLPPTVAADVAKTL